MERVVANNHLLEGVFGAGIAVLRVVSVDDVRPVPEYTSQQILRRQHQLAKTEHVRPFDLAAGHQGAMHETGERTNEQAREKVDG